MKVSSPISVALFFTFFVISVFGNSAGYSPTIYFLSDSIVGSNFYKSFDFEAIPDPTHGRVNYVDQTTAQAQNLTYASHDTFILRTDFKTILSADGAGRNSVRIRSKKTYTTHVAIFDVRHMPQGCGTWPAIWEVKEDGWPSGGEIDIVEGVNDQPPNAVTIHSTSGCTMPASRDQTGTSGQLDCDWTVNYNAGCGVKMPATNSYGPPFNANGGGWYALERTAHYMKVWFWARDDSSVPHQVRHGEPVINTEGWGTPTAYFPDTDCDFSTHFSEHNIIINLTLCGDWAGNVYSQTSCPSTCIDYVNNNPSAFEKAYFDFASVKIYLTGFGDSNHHRRNTRRHLGLDAGGSF